MDRGLLIDAADLSEDVRDDMLDSEGEINVVSRRIWLVLVVPTDWFGSVRDEPFDRGGEILFGLLRSWLVIVVLVGLSVDVPDDSFIEARHKLLEMRSTGSKRRGARDLILAALGIVDGGMCCWMKI